MRCLPRRPANAGGRAGFTLLELLVVIGIIGLLTAILVPGLIQSRLLAKRVVCQANLATIGKASALYQSDHPDYIPIRWGNISPDKQHPWKSWRAGLLAYLPGYAALNCPAVTDRGALGERAKPRASRG